MHLECRPPLCHCPAHSVGRVGLTVVLDTWPLIPPDTDTAECKDDKDKRVNQRDPSLQDGLEANSELRPQDEVCLHMEAGYRGRC